MDKQKKTPQQGQINWMDENAFWRFFGNINRVGYLKDKF